MSEEASFDLYWRHFDMTKEEYIGWLIISFHFSHFCKLKHHKYYLKTRFSSTLAVLESGKLSNSYFYIFGMFDALRRKAKRIIGSTKMDFATKLFRF